jgi:hypothetical protein
METPSRSGRYVFFRAVVVVFQIFRPYRTVSLFFIFYRHYVPSGTNIFVSLRDALPSHRDIDVCKNLTAWKPRPGRDDMFFILAVDVVFQIFRP